MAHLAALDIGSNSVKITMALAGDPLHRVVAKISKVTSLGQGFESGRLQPEAMRRTVRAIVQELDWLREKSGHCRLVVAATSAVRDAVNGQEFLEMLTNEAGFASKPYLLSGDQEAEYTFAGAVGLFPKGVPVLNSDPGGGSTEVAAGNSDGVMTAHRSFRIGAVRWMEKYGLENAASAEVCEQSLADTTALFREFADNVPAGVQLSVSGGIPYCAARLVAGGEVAVGTLDTRVYAADLKPITDKLRCMSCEERKSVPGMIVDRANVMLAALIILRSLMAAYGFEYYIPNPRGLRHGLLAALDDGRIEPQLEIG